MSLKATGGWRIEIWNHKPGEEAASKATKLGIVVNEWQQANTQDSQTNGHESGEVDPGSRQQRPVLEHINEEQGKQTKETTRRAASDPERRHIGGKRIAQHPTNEVNQSHPDGTSLLFLHYSKEKKKMLLSEGLLVKEKNENRFEAERG